MCRPTGFFVELSEQDALRALQVIRRSKQHNHISNLQPGLMRGRELPLPSPHQSSDRDTFEVDLTQRPSHSGAVRRQNNRPKPVGVVFLLRVGKRAVAQKKLT
jgi:hypothetical protein